MKTYATASVIAMCSLLVGCGGGGGGGETSTLSQTSVSPLKNKLVSLSSIELTQTDDSDLAAFGAAVGNAKIVVLNESTHGAAETLRLIARLTKYLHTQKNFEVFLIESGIFDLQRMVEMKKQLGVSYLDSAPGRIYFDTSRSTAGRILVKYLDDAASGKTPLELAGVDLMMAGDSSVNELLPRLEAFLSKNASSLPKTESWNSYKEVAKKVMSLEQLSLPSRADRAKFSEMTILLKQELCNTPYIDGQSILASKAYWCRVVDSMEYESRYLWNFTGGNLDWSVRDLAQGANASWFIDAPYKGKKIILFTNSLHGLEKSHPEITDNTASELAKRYAGQIHTVMISAGKLYVGPEQYLAPLSKNELESVMDMDGLATRYLAYPEDPALQSQIAAYSIREHAYKAKSPNSFGRYYQSLFYIPSQNITDTNWNKYPSKLWPQSLD